MTHIESIVLSVMLFITIGIGIVTALVEVKNSQYLCSCGRTDRRFDYECEFCGDLFTGGELK